MTLTVTQNTTQNNLTITQSNVVVKLQPVINASAQIVETDPIFQASEASLFVTGDKANLDNQSGINSGDETTLSIQTKRPLKTVNNESLEGSGNIQIDYNDLDNLPVIPTPISNHSELNLDDGTNPHGTTKADVGLSNVDNTSDVDKPISTATQVALNLKLDKVSTAGVERAYIINADGSQGTKATSEFKDVLEFADFDAFPTTGESGKIYLDLYTNKTYRWTGSAYVQIGNVPEVEQQLQRYWYSMTANTLNTNLMLVNNTNAFTVSGTASVVSRSSTTYYNSLAMNNYLSATASGSNCGIKNNNQGDGSYLEGFDSSFVFINNDTNVNCETTVGYYGLLSAIPNISKSAYNTNFVGVGNDVGDVNLSFYCKRNTETPSYTKVDCGSSFPAHTTTDAYLLRMQMSRGYHGGVGNTRTLKMTIINIITGAVFSHTFTDSQIPSSSANIAMVVNRSNRNTGVVTNIRFSKWHQTKYIY